MPLIALVLGGRVILIGWNAQWEPTWGILAMRYRKYMYCFVGGCSALIALVVVFCFSVKTDVLVFGDGVIRPADWAEIRPLVEGVVTEKRSQSGDLVRKGDVVLVLDSRKESLEVEKARREIAIVRAQLKAIADRQREARAQLEQARADLAGAKSAEDVRRAEIAISTLRGEIEVAEARLVETRKQHRLSREATESKLAIAREQLKKLLLIQHDRQREHELTRELTERGMESQNTTRRLESEWKRAAADVGIKRHQIKDLERRMKAGFTEGIAETQNRLKALKRSEGFLSTQVAEARKAREARIQKARAAVKRAELAVDVSAETAVAKQRLEKWKIQEQGWIDAIGRKSVRAPVSGRLHDLHVQTGETVSHKNAVAIVCGTRRHLFKVGIAQIDAPQIRVGQPTHVYLESFPHRRYGAFEGRVETITTSLTGLTGEAREGDAQSSCEAWIAIEDPRFDFRVGYRGSAEIVVGRARIAHWLLGLYENDLAREPDPVEAARVR